MKVSEFVKKVLVPVLSALFLAALFRPLCVEDGQCDYLKLWLCMGIPFGVHRMFLWLVPRGYDIGGTMGVLAVNLLIGGVIGGAVLVWRLLVAAVCLVKTAASTITWIIKKVTGRDARIS
ncbi:MAG: hypothetical protein HFI88_15055 [Lachnospiraceae bacterium]|nr:hypothetical protein [Lachnospiraceae bacterium]